MRDHADQLTFREWLVRQLVLTRWSASCLEPEALAAKIGVREDVLLEAITLREQERAQKGKPFARNALRDHIAFADVTMPPPIYRAWKQYSVVIGVERSTLLRSLIHHLLLSRARPQLLSEIWKYQGQIYRHAVRKVAHTRARITRGAQTALDHLAYDWNVSRACILRGLILEALEGRVQRLKLVALSELWGDPDRYLHPEKFLPSPP